MTISKSISFKFGYKNHLMVGLVCLLQSQTALAAHHRSHHRNHHHRHLASEETPDSNSADFDVSAGPKVFTSPDIAEKFGDDRILELRSRFSLRDWLQKNNLSDRISKDADRELDTIHDDLKEFEKSYKKAGVTQVKDDTYVEYRFKEVELRAQLSEKISEAQKILDAREIKQSDFSSFQEIVKAMNDLGYPRKGNEAEEAAFETLSNEALYTAEEELADYSGFFERALITLKKLTAIPSPAELQKKNVFIPEMEAKKYRAQTIETYIRQLDRFFKEDQGAAPRLFLSFSELSQFVKDRDDSVCEALGYGPSVFLPNLGVQETIQADRLYDAYKDQKFGSGPLVNQDGPVLKPSNLVEDTRGFSAVFTRSGGNTLEGGDRYGFNTSEDHFACSEKVDTRPEMVSLLSE